MNPLKHLPKLHKRDKVKEKITFYRGIIGDTCTPLFNTKSDLYQHVASEYSAKPISSLILQKVTLENLIQ